MERRVIFSVPYPKVIDHPVSSIRFLAILLDCSISFLPLHISFARQNNTIYLFWEISILKHWRFFLLPRKQTSWVIWHHNLPLHVCRHHGGYCWCSASTSGWLDLSPSLRNSSLWSPTAQTSKPSLSYGFYTHELMRLPIPQIPSSVLLPSLVSNFLSLPPRLHIHSNFFYLFPLHIVTNLGGLYYDLDLNWPPQALVLNTGSPAK